MFGFDSYGMLDQLENLSMGVPTHAGTPHACGARMREPNQLGL